MSLMREKLCMDFTDTGNLGLLIYAKRKGPQKGIRNTHGGYVDRKLLAITNKMVPPRSDSIPLNTRCWEQTAAEGCCLLALLWS